MAKIALVDDHILLRKGLSSLIQSLGHQIVFEADHGQDMINKLTASAEPDIILLDINMPIMDGFVAADWIAKQRPQIKVLALSMYDNENSIIRMLQKGAKGYILKDCEPAELQSAIAALMRNEYHHSEMVSGRLINAIVQLQNSDSPIQQIIKLNEREMEFLKLCCTELNYKEIADIMHLSPRTIDGYRDAVFEKLQLKTRTGLVLYAIRNSIVVL
ncbi:MAG: response regulator transcription factor [Pedobacter sp.]|nr:MAG: response regulator transcription factor [Pedobacter sp.]